MRFRQKPVALVADIEAMFHQVKVKDSDKDALRFLWWPNGDISKEPIEYCMNVHLFGATSSPSCAAFSLKRTARDNSHAFSDETVGTIERNFYVDDLLKSVSDEKNACRQRLGWDEKISEADAECWSHWLASLSELSKVSIERCLEPIALDRHSTKTELHIFSDASEKAYGSAAYLKVYDAFGNIKCSLIIGKSRLAPIKTLSIPRLELAAAVLAVKLYQLVTQELDIEIHDTIFWTDSMIVLGYINNVKKRFKTFVANRLSYIHDVTTPKDWRYVPSKLNPADLASRGFYPYDTDKLSFWLNGPNFILKDRISWPEIVTNLPVSDDDIDVKPEVNVNLSQGKQCKGIDDLLTRYSDWHKLQRAVGWLLRFKTYLVERYLRGNKVSYAASKHLTINEIRAAKSAVFKLLQMEIYGDEIRSVIQAGNVSKSSSLVRLNPHHRPETQQMGQLPEERLMPDKAPFTYVGVDYFGPMTVKSGRRHLKRYGCLFTCLTTRAVHIEIAHSLDTDSFVCALQRFIGRRGNPEKIFSDNGTNFVSGERVLRDSIQLWNNSRLTKFCQQREIKWHFNPPYAPHMGGVWERLVRSAKTALKSVIREQLLNDEALLTLVVEIEKILNDRPITQMDAGIFIEFTGKAEMVYTAEKRGRQRPCTCMQRAFVAGQWPLGLVLDVSKGRDGLVRSCKHPYQFAYSMEMIFVIDSGGSVGSFHSGSRQQATLNLLELSSATASFLDWLSSSFART
ncbi:uncharacterized protein LOC132750911 [Ruditapes philippinarum]|uniref:uncharacterized protein LOC132750911 n=1 Tax=Ruditapes philippinarum TaxID=129788 RepID=UPI00295AE41C|nr:uncharacterized protein LOC132750911 [Ruditapes philippinarum]